MGRWLVGDIGGTNARFAHCAAGGGQLSDVATFDTASAATVVELIAGYLDSVAGEHVEAGSIACAGPIMGDRCSLTNSSLVFSIDETRRAIGLETLLVVNDFAAVARSVPQVPAAELLIIGDSSPRRHRVAVAIGPGTGLGVATVFKSPSGVWTVLPGEGGHVALSALADDELEVVRELRRRFGFASAEMVLSGPGLTRLFTSLTRIHSWAPGVHEPSPQQIVEAACAGSDTHALACLEMFCALLGSVAANAALTAGADGGVFLGGGILKRFPDFLKQSSFRERFTSHPQAGEYLASIGTALITSREPGLVGAMHLLIDDSADSLAS
jgi:glucokinase